MREKMLKRREFIVFGIGLLVSMTFLTTLGIRRAKAIRPPGVEDEEEFLSLCIRCGRCVDVCPTKGLTLNHLTLEGLGTPILEGFCAVYLELTQPTRLKNMEFKKRRWGGQLCFKCIDSCPTRALKRLPLSKVKIAKIEIDPEECKKAECYVCIDVCPFDAIGIGGDGLPIIDLEKCIGCRQCEKLCPYNAMVAEPV
ncbi:MAG: 4Fe-4S binding protein [Thermoproteota archaeon]